MLYSQIIFYLLQDGCTWGCLSVCVSGEGWFKGAMFCGLRVNPKDMDPDEGLRRGHSRITIV